MGVNFGRNRKRKLKKISLAGEKTKEIPIFLPGESDIVIIRRAKEIALTPPPTPPIGGSGGGAEIGAAILNPRKRSLLTHDRALEKRPIRFFSGHR